MAKHPAAFINAIAEDGTKDEAVRYLQSTWDDLCDLRATVAAAPEHHFTRDIPGRSPAAPAAQPATPYREMGQFVTPHGGRQVVAPAAAAPEAGAKPSATEYTWDAAWASEDAAQYWYDAYLDLWEQIHEPERAGVQQTTSLSTKENDDGNS